MADPQTAFTTQDLDNAFRAVCFARKDHPPGSDIWHIRFHWSAIKPDLLRTLNDGEYRLTAMPGVTDAEGRSCALWNSADAVVLKAVTEKRADSVPVHPACKHLKGHGGGKQSVRRLHDAIRSGRYHFVFRTDIRQYYRLRMYHRVC